MDKKLKNSTTRPHLLFFIITLLTRAIPSTQACFDAVTSSLTAGDYKVFSHALHSQNLTDAHSAPLTFFVPSDSALDGQQLDVDALRRHIARGEAFTFQSLFSLPHGTKLPTLHPNATIHVKGGADRLYFNDVAMTVPDLFFDGFCAAHGIDAPLVPIQSSPEPVGIPAVSAPPHDRLANL